MYLADRRCQHAAMAVLLELPWILAAGGIGFMWISRKRYPRSNVLEPSAVRLNSRVNLLFIAIQCPQRTSTVLGKKMSLSWRLARSLLSGSHQNHFPDKNCGCALQVVWEYPTSAQDTHFDRVDQTTDDEVSNAKSCCPIPLHLQTGQWHDTRRFP